MDNSFIELIKDIKKDDSIKNLEKNYQKCISYLKELDKKKSSDKLFSMNSVIKEKSLILLKLLYLQMFGKKIDKEHNFSVIELLTCNKYFLKRRGFFFLNNISDNDDIIFLCINLFKKELYKDSISSSEYNSKGIVLSSLSNIGAKLIKENINIFNNNTNNSNNINSMNSFHGNNFFESSNDGNKKNNLTSILQVINKNNDEKIFNTFLILNSISNICTDIMSCNLYNDIFFLLNNSNVYIRKKTILCFYKLVVSNLSILNTFFDIIKKNFIALYNNENPSYEKLPYDQVDYTFRNNTCLCCLIINVLAEIFSYLERRQRTYDIQQVKGGEYKEGAFNLSTNNNNKKKNQQVNIIPTENDNNIKNNSDNNKNNNSDNNKNNNSDNNNIKNNSDNNNIKNNSDNNNIKNNSDNNNNNNHCDYNHCDDNYNNSTDEHAISNYLKKFLSFVPFIYNLLNERLSIIDNWKIIKFIKFINKLVKYEYRIYKKFLPIIIHIFFTNKAKSVIFECYNFILFNYKKNYNVHMPNVDSYINMSLSSQNMDTSNNMNIHDNSDIFNNTYNNNNNNILINDNRDSDNHDSDNHNSDHHNILPNSSHNKKMNNNSEEFLLSQENINTHNIEENNNKKKNNVDDTPFDKFLFYCFKQLLSSFFTDDRNIVYMTTNLYKYLFIIPDIYEYFIRYNLLNEFSRNILKNFYHKDITIRKKLLYILYYLINEQNFQQIVYSILIYLYNHNNNYIDSDHNVKVKPFDYVDEYIHVILNYCINNLNHLPNVNVYIFILFYLLCLKNHTKENEILEQIHKINKQLNITHMTTNFLSCIFIITYALGFIKDTMQRNDDIYVKNNKLEINKLLFTKDIRNDINDNDDHHHNIIKQKNIDTYNISYNHIQMPNTVTDVICPPIHINKEKENFKNKSYYENEHNYYFLEIISNYQDKYEYILINDIYNLKKEIKNFNILNKYDVFEYIIIILKLYDKIYPDVHYMQGVLDKSNNDDPLYLKRKMNEEYQNVQDKYVHVEEKYVHVEEKYVHVESKCDDKNIQIYKDNNIKTCEYFLKYNRLDHIKIESYEYIIYFITIYLEETYDKIKEFKDMIFLKIFFFTLYLFFISFNSANILWNVIKIFMFFFQFEENYSLILFYFYRCYIHVNYLIEKKNDVYNLDICILIKNILSLLLNTKKENYKNFNFYNYFVNTILYSQQNEENHFDLNKPFKYDDSFFFINTELNKGKSETTNKKHKNIKNKEKQTKKNIQTSITNELHMLKNKYKEYKEKWINTFPFYIIYQNDHFKLYFKHQKDNNELILYIHLKNDTFILYNFNLYTSFNLINYNILDKHNSDYSNINDDMENNFYKYNITNQNMDTYSNHHVNNKNYIQIKNINMSIFISIKYDNLMSDIKFCYEYFLNTDKLKNNGLLIIPHVKMDPLNLSMQDFKKINNINAVLRNINYQITTEKNCNIYKLLFSYFLFLSQYLNISFLNMNNIFVNLKNEVHMNELRIIFCICRSADTSESTKRHNIILLLNVQPQKKEESDMSYIYSIYIKMKILNNSQDDSNKLLDYFEFYINQLFLQKIKNSHFLF
ncbi:putative AP-3 complex subunit delta [Plasmodium gaboni]|uniref:Putative AP-3 complex subunit delta n=1 Tax=Plasmodium gaboni TaxID=647221 RepID=A0A151LNC8_9APIC|nr:putative AP-3 complex subunit delta [Plasmodium gaboni]KYO00684.1 putative AP-3 complex subunit delta [Plasmodium gaboni]